MSTGRCLLILYALACASLAPDPARAQSAAPIGLWQGQNSNDYILVRANGDCSCSGSVNVAGTCTWQSSAIGGILTMTYPWVLEPGHLYWNMRWIDNNTLLVNEVERFVRRG